jgi:hypothetical protein
MFRQKLAQAVEALPERGFGKIARITALFREVLDDLKQSLGDGVLGDVQSVS